MKNSIHRSKTAMIIGALLGTFAAQASAQSLPPYVQLEIGKSQIGLKASDIEEPGLDLSGGDRSDLGYAITLGWRITEQLAVEGSFVQLGEGKYDIDEVDGDQITDARLKVRSRGVLFSLVGNWPLSDLVTLEGRAGIYLGKNETRVSGVLTNPLGSQSFNSLLGTDSKTGLAAGVGATFALSETWGLRAGYDYVDTAFGKDAGRVSVGVRYNWP